MVRDGEKNPNEESYFDKLNREALAALHQKEQLLRNSPVTGEPMKPITIQGAACYRCESSGGIWIEDISALQKGSPLQALIEKEASDNS